MKEEDKAIANIEDFNKKFFPKETEKKEIDDFIAKTRQKLSFKYHGEDLEKRVARELGKYLAKKMIDKVKESCKKDIE